MHRTRILCWSRLPNEGHRKGRLLIASLVGMVMTAFHPWAYADVFVSNGGNNILRYDERTGDFLGEIVPSGSGGLNSPMGLVFGPDGNLYVSSLGTNSILRYDGITGEPLPSPGNVGATFVPAGSGGLTDGAFALIFGPDGNLYASSGGGTAPASSSSVLRYHGTTGEFIDAFVPPGSGGLTGPRGLVFGPDGNLYVNANNSGPGAVLRYNGTTGAFIDVFVPSGSNPFGENRPGNSRGLVFGPDGNLYVGSFPATHPSILRYDGQAGALIDAFVSEGSGGLRLFTGPLFGPDGNLYVRSDDGNQGVVLRYDGTTGAFLDQFIPYGSGGQTGHEAFVFRNSHPVTLAYVPGGRLHITAAPTAVAGTPLDVAVTALGPSGNIDSTFQGTVTFTTTDPGSGVMLPAAYTFTTGDAGDNGVHTFSGAVTLVTVGDQTLTVTDTVSGIAGSAAIAVGPGP